MYIITIDHEPEIFNNEKVFFWCILKNNKVNVGHGWSKSMNDAYEDAKKYLSMLGGKIH